MGKMKDIALELEQQGIKYDQDKPRMDLLDAKALTEVAQVMTFGAKKYGDNNWRRGLKYSRLIAAALRHIFAYNSGESNDPETGLSHIAHAMCCLMMLLGTSKAFDDRHCNASVKPEKEEPIKTLPCYPELKHWEPDGYGGWRMNKPCKECKCEEK